MPQARTRRHAKTEKKIPFAALQDPFEQEDALDEMEIDDGRLSGHLPVTLFADMEQDDDDYFDARMTGLGDCIDHHLRDHQN